MKLIMFDLDGTLVEDHLVDEGLRCPNCGSTEIIPGPRWTCAHDPCGAEFEKPLPPRLVPRTDRAYTDPILIDGVHERVREIAEIEDTVFAVCTNQGGVALGFQTELEVHERINRSLVGLDWFFHCPFSLHVSYAHPNGKGKWADPSKHELRLRKPEPGMLEQAKANYPLLSRLDAVFVGDRETDKNAALRGQFPFAFADDWIRRGNAALGL